MNLCLYACKHVCMHGIVSACLHVCAYYVYVYMCECVCVKSFLFPINAFVYPSILGCSCAYLIYLPFSYRFMSLLFVASYVTSYPLAFQRKHNKTK